MIKKSAFIENGTHDNTIYLCRVFQHNPCYKYSRNHINSDNTDN